MRVNDEKQSLLDYVKFILAAPVSPGTEKKLSEIRMASGRLQRCSTENPLAESYLAMDLMQLICELRDKRLQHGN
jgi:hypothetical protein